jgi:hypothetical protein
MNNHRRVAKGFLVVECDYVLELLEATIASTPSVTHRADFYRGEQISAEKVWRWAVRCSRAAEFASIVDALGWLKALSSSQQRCADAHDKRQLAHAECSLLQALHFNNIVRQYHVCNLSFADACRFNVDAAWADTNSNCSYTEGSTVEHVRLLFE